MCGINGIVGFENDNYVRQLIVGMNKTLNHRGPDDKGVFVKPGIALGQRRLSIIDLSKAGHQPMLSADKRFVITFNGEIYNFRNLKSQLKNYPFTTQTDTEILLAAYQKWGKSCLDRLEGMFAFAIWDRTNNELFLARDRLGIKPLYYYQKNKTLLFSSEIRSLLTTGIVPRQLYQEGLADYLRYQTVHAPATIIKNVKMLMPGHFMTFKMGNINIKEYWNLVNNKPEVLTEDKKYGDITKYVEALLRKAVEKRLMTDVPLGAFLSGGIDSSVIVGLMSQLSNQKVNTFSVSFEEEKYDESKYARMVANKFNTDHTEINLKSEDFLEYLPNALNAMDHPSGDGPNTYVVSKVTKDSGITVALSGLGGDELFAGYKNFKRLKKLTRNQWVLKLPSFSRAWIGGLLEQVKPDSMSAKLSDVLKLPSWEINYTYPIVRQILQEQQLTTILNQEELQSNRVAEILHDYGLNGNVREKSLPTFSKISVAVMSTYMQNVLLRDTDQMGMASALEVRVPFLDHHLIEYVFAISDIYKHPSTPKKLLTDATKDLLPHEIKNRSKKGFTLPWQKWLKKDLKSFCAQELRRLGKRKEFNHTAIQALWHSFLQGDARVGWSRIWILVVLGFWLHKHNIEN